MSAVATPVTSDSRDSGALVIAIDLGASPSPSAVVDEVMKRLSGTTAARSVFLDFALEATEDPWPVLRAVWRALMPGGEVRVRYGSSGQKFVLGSDDVRNLLLLSGFAATRQERSVHGFVMAAGRRDVVETSLSTTVVVPCRNEVGNVDSIVRRLPKLGSATELLFVDGASSDGTPERIQQLIVENPERDIRLSMQTGDTGKAGASFQGFSQARGDVVMILDADMTVKPEDLPRFYLALAEGVAEFANGTRMVYPMESAAMPSLNRVGNRAFSAYFSWLLGAHITDTLCGTKALFRRDIPKLLNLRPLFGGHDPWGDFDMLIAAGCLGLRVIDVPVSYVAREAGESKMRPFAHGLALARTSAVGAYRLKLRPPRDGTRA